MAEKPIFKSVGRTGAIRHFHLDDPGAIDHDQYQATEESFERLMALIAEIQNMDGIQPTNNVIDPAGGVLVLTWGITDEGERMVGNSRV